MTKDSSHISVVEICQASAMLNLTESMSLLHAYNRTIVFTPYISLYMSYVELLMQSPDELMMCMLATFSCTVWISD